MSNIDWVGRKVALKDGHVLNKFALFQATKFVIVCYGNKQANINTFIDADGISILSIDPIMSFITFAPYGHTLCFVVISF